MGVWELDWIMAFENDAIPFINDEPWIVKFEFRFVEVPIPTLPIKKLGVKEFIWFIEFEKFT